MEASDTNGARRMHEQGVQGRNLWILALTLRFRLKAYEQGCSRWIFQNMDFLGFIGLAQIHVIIWAFSFSNSAENTFFRQISPTYVCRRLLPPDFCGFSRNFRRRRAIMNFRRHRAVSLLSTTTTTTTTTTAHDSTGEQESGDRDTKNRNITVELRKSSSSALFPLDIWASGHTATDILCIWYSVLCLQLAAYISLWSAVTVSLLYRYG